MSLGDKNRQKNCEGRKNRRKALDVALIGIFLALVLMIGLLERMIPLDFAIPGVRLGLSNVVILLSLYCFRFRIVACIVLLKCVLLAALAGGASAFLYSICGSLLSFLAMWLLIKSLGERIGPVGVSVVGAVCHIAGQLLVASMILEDAGIFIFMPVLAIAACISGVLVGLLVKYTLPAVVRFRRSA